MDLRKTSSWRTEVRTQAQRLDDELGRAPENLPSSPTYVAVRSAIDRARVAAETPSTPATWWSGSLIESAWAALQNAREGLALIEDESVARSRLPYVRQLAARAGGTVDLVKALDDSEKSPQVDRQVVRQVWEQAHVATDSDHAAIRGLRNVLYELTAVVTVLVLAAATVVDTEHRTVIAVGALAGALTAVLPLASASKMSGPYSLAVPQVVLKVATGALAALLSVVLLRGGLAGFKAATGDTALFYAVIFGLSQQALTQLADKQVATLTSGSASRTDPAMRVKGKGGQG